MTNQQLIVLKEEFTIHRYDKNGKIPPDVLHSNFYWIGKTDEELSIVCDSLIKLKSVKEEPGWKAIKLIGPFAFTEIGIVASITKVLSENSIGVFVISTFDTDYVLVKKEDLEDSVEALKLSCYTFLK
jgi:uncharacterized protein